MMLDRSQEFASTADSIAAPKAETGFAGFDQRFHASIARLTGGLSPLALSQAYTDWAEHLLMSPDKQAALVHDLIAASARFYGLLPARWAGRQYPSLHRAASAGYQISGRGMAAMALQRPLPRFSAHPAVVAQGGNRCAWGLQAP
jgi:Poly-beta-hydroxybutyrate polymerase N terminal